jgi:hypothetical protein
MRRLREWVGSIEEGSELSQTSYRHGLVIGKQER